MTLSRLFRSREATHAQIRAAVLRAMTTPTTPEDHFLAREWQKAWGKL